MKPGRSQARLIICCARCSRWIGQQNFVPVGICTLPFNPRSNYFKNFPRTYAGNSCGCFDIEVFPPPFIDYTYLARQPKEAA